MKKKLLREYLINIETWTHYETVLFNNSMFILDNEFIELVFAKINYNIEKYSTLRYYGNESIRMFINMVILYIDRQDLIRKVKVLEITKRLSSAGKEVTLISNGFWATNDRTNFEDYLRN